MAFDLKARGPNFRNAQYLTNVLAVKVAKSNEASFTCGGKYVAKIQSTRIIGSTTGNDTNIQKV